MRLGEQAAALARIHRVYQRFARKRLSAPMDGTCSESLRKACAAPITVMRIRHETC